MGSANFGQLDARAALLQKDAGLFHDTTSALKQAGENFEGLFIGIAAAVAPLMLAGARLFNSQNAVAWGQTIGAGITKAVDFAAGIWTKPKLLLDAMLADLKLSLAEDGDFTANAFAKAGKVLGEGLNLGVNLSKILGQTLEGYAMKAGGGLISGLGKSMVFLESGLEYAFERALVVLNDGWTITLGAIQDGLSDAFRGAAVVLEKALAAIWTGIKAVMHGIGAALEKLPGMSKALVNTFEHAWDNNPFVQQAKKESKSSEGGYHGESFDTIYNRNLSNSKIVGFGDKMAASGGAMLEGLGAQLKNAVVNFGAQVSQIMALPGTDFFGADKLREDLLAKLNAVFDAGQQAVAAIMPPDAGAAVDKWKTFKGWITFGGPQLDNPFAGGMGLAGADVQGASMNLSTPFGQTSLLSHREWERINDGLVAAGAGRQASSPGAFHAIHSGDHRREREFQKQQLLAQQGLEGINQKLTTVINLVQGMQ